MHHVVSSACFPLGATVSYGVREHAFFVPSEGARPARWYYASCPVPPDIMAMFVARRQYIGQLELLADGTLAKHRKGGSARGSMPS